VLIESPGSASQKVTLNGDVDVGKTAIAKRFGLTIESLAEERWLNFGYIHANCYKGWALLLVGRKVAQQLLPGLSKRGLSAQEVFGKVWGALEVDNAYLLLTLDEMAFLVADGNDSPLYFLTRMADEYIGKSHRINQIPITRNLEFVLELDRFVQSTILHNIVRFERYAPDQLYDIIKVRSQESIKEGTVGDGVLSTTAEIVATCGDARYALEPLWWSGKHTDADGLSKILPEHVRRAESDTLQFPIRVIMDLPLHERLFLLSVARAFKKEKSAYIIIGEAESMYRILCEARSIKPRKQTQILKYFQNLKNLGVLQARITGSSFKDKVTLIGPMDIPAETLEFALTGGA